MEKSTQSKQISIQPKQVFGLRTDIVGNIHFTIKQEIIYPVAGVLAVHDYTTNKQKFLRFPEKCTLERIVISPDRKFIAVSEIIDQKSIINVYEITTLRKRKTLQLPPDCPNTQIGNICFTFDSRGMAVLSKEPDAFLSIFSFDKNESLIIGRASSSSQQGQAKYLSCNPADATIVAVGGYYMLKIMNKTDKGFGQIGTIKGDNLLVTSIMWLTPEILAAGTAETEIIFVEAGELKLKFKADEVDLIDLAKDIEGEVQFANNTAEDPTSAKKANRDVLCLTQFEKGFLFSIHNAVHVFEKESAFTYLKKTVVTIPITLYDQKLYKIINVAVNEQQDTIIAATLHSQIYIGMLYVPETLKVSEIEFRPVGEPLHVDAILGLAVCSWKSIILTSSRDQTIRVWNYKTMKLELVKKFQIEIGVIDLHPSGFFAAIGFIDQLRMMEIQLDDLKVTKTFNYPNCCQLKFSNQGHLLAAAHGKLITLICIFTFDVLRVLKGHNGSVLSMVWSTDDSIIVSGGIDGAIYKWNTVTGERLEEVVQKGIEYRSLALTSDQNAVYSITNSGLIREMTKSDISRQFKIPELTPLTDIVLSRSDYIMFVASEKGHLYNILVPLVDTSPGNCTNFRFYDTKITKMKITYDDALLITVAADGTLIIWTILNNEGKTAPIAPELGQCSDVLIARNELIDKVQTISTLELRIQQQITEFQYKMMQGDVFHSEQMRDIHKGYCDAIEELKKKNEEMEMSHLEEFNLITASIAQSKEEHQKEMMDFESEFHEKIIIEYEKLTNIKNKMDAMKEDYEVKLRRSAGCLQDTIESLEADYKKQLNDKQEIIEQSMEDMEKKKIEFSEYCKQVDIDNDRNKVELQLNYEKKLKDEEETCIKWRGEAGVLRKKFSTLTKEADVHRKEIDTLHSQHSKFQQTIRQYQKDLEELRKEVQERDSIIRDKEKRVNDLQKKNQELEKYKLVLSHKINDLKGQIEPREKKIKEKKEIISEMEKELETSQQNNQQLKLQLNELRDKYHGIDIELRTERNRSRGARAQTTRICGEIYNLSELIQKPDQLKKSVKDLYHKYSDDVELKKSLALDVDVQNEFLRQRVHLEKLSNSSKSKDNLKKDNGDASRLLRENISLITELNKLRESLKLKQHSCTQMESILGFSSKYISPRQAKEKLERAVADKEQMEMRHNEQISKFQDMIKSLSMETQSLRAELKASNTRKFCK